MMWLRLELTVNYDDSTNPDRDAMINQLRSIAEYAASNGMLTGYGPEIVDWWSTNVKEIVEGKPDA